MGLKDHLSFRVLEPLPAAELATRLRELPLFASLSIDELFRMASTARQVRHDPGSVLLQEGEVPETFHFLLDGRVIASSRDGAPRSIAAPAALGFAFGPRTPGTRPSTPYFRYFFTHL